ncbi:uncharacterized protein G2W53_008173 [Senna tora]|uniref:Uncharacterized protein n=1 Tax=Senna tora TaxID=362788 RepID=A0A834X7D8_9FABA|nr:uncharacterized protein G2W53_008173 [Senna tora]
MPTPRSGGTSYSQYCGFFEGREPQLIDKSLK